MLFNSLEFIFLYVPFTLIIFYLVSFYSQNYAMGFLALMSIVFYATWSPSFTLLLLLSIIINYTGGVLLSRVQQLNAKKCILLGFLLINFGVLFYYKYIYFFILNCNLIFGTDLPLLRAVLPIGISFFTFTQIAFLVDVYKGYAKEYNLLHYTLFVTYFPHLVAGPVLHHAQMMPQFAEKKLYSFDIGNLSFGIFLFIIGLSKKVLLADNLGELVTPIFDSVSELSPDFSSAWRAALGYYFQLYFDFSGYSDMAVGLALMMGVSLPINFNSPYKAKNIIDFWRRWHISLSKFLLNYLYIPLGGNKNGSFNRYRNLLITMLLGGLWHGASWNFIIWGGLHGFYLVTNHLFRMLKFPAWMQKIRGIGLLQWTLTFLCVLVAWVFFRAPTLEKALHIIKGMFFVQDINLSFFTTILFSKTIFFCFIIVTLMPNSMEILDVFKKVINSPPQNIMLPIKFQPSGRVNGFIRAFSYFSVYGLGIILAMLATINIISLNKVSYFIYFQF